MTGVVGWRSPILVEAKNLSRVCCENLRLSEVAACGKRDIQLSIMTESQPGCPGWRLAYLILEENDWLTQRVFDSKYSDDPIHIRVQSTRRVSKKHVVVARELRGQSQSDESRVCCGHWSGLPSTR